VPLDPRQEQACLEALRKGIDQALNQIIENWEGPLFSYAWRYVQNNADARDVVAETFVRLYQQRERLRPDTHLSAWLYTTLTNLCHNQHRWRRRHPSVSLDATDEETGESLGDRTSDGSEHPAQQLEREESLAELRQAIDRLPHELKTTLLLHHYEHLSYKDIGMITNCSERGVETRLYRAKQRLREDLESRPREAGHFEPSPQHP